MFSIADVEGSKSHEYIPPSAVELESFFKTLPRLEKISPQHLEYAVKFGEGKNVETSLDLYAELQRILQQKKGEEDKTDQVILEQLKCLFKAFNNHKKKGQNQLDIYL